ncbi:MAG: hypothetical protein HDR38_05370 [Treponema sp.]|nr:hypothetical protein [Treponema sp.]
MKKRLSKLALLAVAAAFMLAGFPACDDGDDGGEPSPVVLASIQVQDKPTKTTYTVNEDFNPAGLVIKEVYSDGNTSDVAYSEGNKDDFAFTGFDASKPSESVTVTVTYKEKTADFTVSVAAKGIDPTKTLSSITVQTPPTKTTYTVSDEFAPAGLVIKATYTDETSALIVYSEENKDDFAFTGFDSSAANESVTVTVTCKEKTTTFIVSVAEAEKSLFETLSAQENTILTEDFAEAFTVDKFGAGFGRLGIYGADGVTVANGEISTGATGTNRKIHVDFGPVKETVEGCVTLTVGGGKNAQTGKNLLTFYNGDTAFLTLKTGTGDNTVGGTEGTYEIYYKFDLTAKTVSLKVNDTDVLTDSALTVDSVSGYTIESHNSGKGTVAADNIAVCATKADLDTYKAQVKAWLATLVTNTYSEEKGYTTNKAAVEQAKNTGDTAIDTAGDIEAVLAAYGSAQTALKAVKNDLAQAQANAVEELKAYFPEGKSESDYTGDKLTAVATAKTTGETAINAATSAEAVNAALAEAKAKIDALPDDSATAYTVTVITNDGTTLGTVDAYKDVASVLDKIKELITDPKQVIADGKFYSEQSCTTEYDTATALTGDVTVYVKLEEKKAETYTYSYATDGKKPQTPWATTSTSSNKSTDTTPVEGLKIDTTNLTLTATGTKATITMTGFTTGSGNASEFIVVEALDASGNVVGTAIKGTTVAGKVNGDISFPNNGVLEVADGFAAIRFTCGTSGKNYSIVSITIEVE